MTEARNKCFLISYLGAVRPTKQHYPNQGDDRCVLSGAEKGNFSLDLSFYIINLKANSLVAEKAVEDACKPHKERT